MTGLDLHVGISLLRRRLSEKLHPSGLWLCGQMVCIHHELHRAGVGECGESM